VIETNGRLLTRRRGLKRGGIIGSVEIVESPAHTQARIETQVPVCRDTQGAVACSHAGAD